MFGHKKRRRRRSEMRLGVQSIEYKIAPTARPALSLTPLLLFFQTRGARLVGLMGLAVLVWIVYILFSSPVFFVSGASIEGNIAVSVQEIYAASGVDNQSIFWIRSADVAQRVMQLPNIKSAEASVSLPANVTITVVERQPEVLWQTGDTIWWVDQEGTTVPPREAVEDMLKIIDDDQRPVKAGDKIDPTIITGALTLRHLVPNVSVVRYSRARGLTVATPEGWPVYLGNGTEMRAKLVVLTAVLADLKARNITPAFIDVRNPLRPFYEPESIIQIPQPASRPAEQSSGVRLAPTPFVP